MKVTVDYSQKQEVDNIRVKKAQYVCDYIIRVWFNDGVEKDIDFAPFLMKSQHPSIKKYLDKALFAKFDIQSGNLNWNDYEMIFPMEDLYAGNIE